MRNTDNLNECRIVEVKSIKGTDDLEIEQYCRCNDGSYSLRDCKRKRYANPCVNDIQFHESPNDMSDQYFIHCAHGLPNLFRCPDFLTWNAEMLTCAGGRRNPQRNEQTKEINSNKYYVSHEIIIANNGSLRICSYE